MYKIYINENILGLAQSDILLSDINNTDALIAPYSGKKKMLLSYIDMLEKTQRFNKIILHFKDFEQLKMDFKSVFKLVIAAGGVVQNQNKDILMIRRLGFWDLPKGKLNKLEKKKDAALREVKEETGIKDLSIISKLSKTRHCYKTGSGIRALKITHWYSMVSSDMELSPQKEENITEAIWKPASFIDVNPEPIYRSIEDLIIKHKNEGSFLK